MPAGAIGACGQINGVGRNLGYVQSSLQAAEDGSISIVYQNGDKCSSGHYSTRIIFQCDDSPVSMWTDTQHYSGFWLKHVFRSPKLCFLLKKGAPMFDRIDGCEYVFIWRTSEACPIKRVQGRMNSQSCQRTIYRSFLIGSYYVLFPHR